MKKLKPFLLPGLCLLTLSITSCGENKNSPQNNQSAQIAENAVVSGKIVSPKNKVGKSIVAILSDQEEGKTLCTGSIIGTNTILTAAHCVENNPKNMQIIFGVDLLKVLGCHLLLGISADNVYKGSYPLSGLHPPDKQDKPATLVTSHRS